MFCADDLCRLHSQLEKVAGGIKVTTDKGEEYEADAVMFAVGMMLIYHLV